MSTLPGFDADRLTNGLGATLAIVLQALLPLRQAATATPVAVHVALKAIRSPFLAYTRDAPHKLSSTLNFLYALYTFAATAPYLPHDADIAAVILGACDVASLVIIAAATVAEPGFYTDFLKAIVAFYYCGGMTSPPAHTPAKGSGAMIVIACGEGDPKNAQAMEQEVQAVRRAALGMAVVPDWTRYRAAAPEAAREGMTRQRAQTGEEHYEARLLHLLRTGQHLVEVKLSLLQKFRRWAEG